MPCRERKAVVLAIRGTSSLADVVTDAVVRPAPVDDWLPEQYKSVRHALSRMTLVLSFMHDTLNSYTQPGPCLS